jgi:hypothetical protein
MRQIVTRDVMPPAVVMAVSQCTVLFHVTEFVVNVLVRVTVKFVFCVAHFGFTVFLFVLDMVSLLLPLLNCLSLFRWCVVAMWRVCWTDQLMYQRRKTGS